MEKINDSLKERFLIACQKVIRVSFGCASLGSVIRQKKKQKKKNSPFSRRSKTKTNQDLLARVLPRSAPVTCIRFEC